MTATPDSIFSYRGDLSWEKSNHCLVHRQWAEDNDSQLIRVDNNAGHFVVDIRFDAMESVVASVLCTNWRVMTLKDKFTWTTSAGKTIEWSKYNSRCGDDFMARQLPHIQLLQWQDEYDALVCGSAPMVSLTYDEWSFHVPQHGEMGTLEGPPRDPEHFMSMAELYLTLVYSRKIGIPWLGKRRTNRRSLGRYELDDAIYIRTTGKTGRPLADGTLPGLIRQMRVVDGDDVDVDDWFHPFCVMLRNDPVVMDIVKAWPVQLLHSHFQRPLLIESFRTLNRLVARIYGSDVDAHIRRLTKNRPLPDSVTQLQEDAPKAWRLGSSTMWCEAVRNLRNAVEHRDERDTTPDMKFDIVTSSAVGDTAFDILSATRDIIWDKIQGGRRPSLGG